MFAFHGCRPYAVFASCCRITMPAPYALGLTSQPEHPEAKSLTVKGTLPPWLRGTLVRNGPGQFEVGDDSYNHWFDGLALLHAFTLTGDGVSYRSRFLRSSAYTEAESEHRITQSAFATDPCRSLFERVMTVFRPQLTDNANVSIHRLAGDWVALTETPMPVRFDPYTLDTLGVHSFDDTLSGPLTTAHPHRTADGTLYSYVVDFSKPTSTYRLFRIVAATNTRHELGTHTVRRPAYMHSFAMTPRYLALVAFPLVVDPLQVLLTGRPFIENFEWQPERGTQVHVFERDTGQRLTTVSTDPMFAFHHINAFEDDDTLCIDMAAYPDARIVDRMYLDALRSGWTDVEMARPERLRVDLNEHTATHERLCDVGIEVPRIHYAKHNGRAYRYAYGAGNRTPGHFTDELVKVDVSAGTAQHWHAPDCFPGEPVFVADPNGTKEDDGVVLSVVLDAAAERSFLLVLDATSFTEIARAEAPQAIPLNFHGQFLHADDPLRGLHR